MIEPLRFCHETSPTYEINRPAFCVQCLSQKQTKNNPNVAIYFCKDCPNLLGENKEYGAFFCKVCEMEKHKVAQTRFHARQILVVGPGVRKKLKVRGDGVSFPCLLDTVTVSVKARVFCNNQRIYTEKSQELTFTSGLSGKCLHIQVLGARNLNIGDTNMSSDPFVVYSFYGKPISSTRVRQRTLNPRWDNETFVVPMSENAPMPREYVATQKEMIKLEVYDHDWITANEFLGHVEMTRSKLLKLALISQEQPIRIPLSAKEFNGIVNFQFGYNQDEFIIKVLGAEDLDKSGSGGMNNPYVSVFVKDKLIGSTHVKYQTIHPKWTQNNEFAIKLSELFEIEYLLLAQLKYYKASVGMVSSSGAKRRQRGGLVYNKMDNLQFDEFQTLPEYLSLFRFEVYHSNGLSILRKDPLIGKLCIHCEQYRKVLPLLPAAETKLTEAQLMVISSAEPATLQVEKTTTSRITDSLRRLIPGSAGSVKRPLPPSTPGSVPEQPPAITDNPQNKPEGTETVIIKAEDSIPPPPDSSRKQRIIAAPAGPPPVDDPITEPPKDSDDTHPTSRVGTAFQTAKQLVSRTFRRGVTTQVSKECQWAPVQRLPIIRKTTKKRDEKLDELGREDYGFLVVRLLLSERGKVIAGLDQAVQRMTIGETSMIKCRYDYAYGNYCFDKMIPPRSNVIFNVQLLEINGQGRWGIFVRQLRRLWRIIVRVLKEIFRFIWFCGRYKSINEDEKKKKRKKKKKQVTVWQTISNFTTGAGTENAESDSDSDSNEDSENDSDEDSNKGGDEEQDGEENGEVLQNLYEAAEESSLQEQENEITKQKAVKMDPRMKKQWNNSVKAGASLLWKLPSENNNRIRAPPISSLSEKLTALQKLENLDEEAGERKVEVDGDWENMNENEEFDHDKLDEMENGERPVGIAEWDGEEEAQGEDEEEEE